MCLGIKGSIAPKVGLFSPASIVASESYLGNKGPECAISNKKAGRIHLDLPNLFNNSPDIYNVSFSSFLS